MKTLFALALAAILCMGSASAFGQVTGFTHTGYRELRAEANLELARTAVYTMNISIPPKARLASLRMSGEVIGNGRANAYIEDDSQDWFVVFAYNNRRNPFSQAVTGLFGGMEEALAGSEASSISFSGKCIETCYLDGNFASGNIVLVFDVEEGTTLKVKDITYDYSTFSETGAGISFKIGKLFSSLVHLFK